jgi:hypothetical protein
VRHLVRTLRDIDEQLLRTVDQEAMTGTAWDAGEPGPPAAGRERESARQEREE